jgi:dienelactone hydrolase
MDTSTPVGTWYLVANKFRLELSIQAAIGGYSGTIKNEGGAPEPLDNITWDAAGRWLEFRRNGPGFFQWYRICLTYGVMAGRFSHSGAAAKPPLTAFTSHVTGWSPNWLDSGSVPRTWNLTINHTFNAVLRIDRDGSNALVGRLKVFANTALPQPLAEELEDDLTAIAWDGTNIAFTRSAGFTQVYQGKANGRFISGTFTHNGGAPLPWNGTRGEVLGFGLGSRLAQRNAWQEATRARIVNLTEGMRLANVGIPPVTVSDQGPAGLFLGGFPAERDDDPNTWPANYTLRKLQFSVPPGSRFDPATPPPPRVYNGLLATPAGPPPPGGFRAVVAVNGHGGSAQQIMTSNDEFFWYGESAARRDLIVLAIDIGHRPKWNTGPIVHPPIIDAGFADSNWEEDGERAFSVRRAIDWLLSQPNVRKDRLFMFGLSLGGEVTTITSGLDPRIEMAIVTGFSPDMRVMDLHGNHPCYLWDHADIHEYLDVSDWEALTAPRPLVVETGKVDFTFSSHTPPFSADKQLTRRARAAYGADASKLIHYLHYDVHHFHVGAANPSNPGRPQGVLAAAVINPIGLGDQTWQTDGSTNLRSPSLYHLMNEFLP